jgi:hypothetical protein
MTKDEGSLPVPSPFRVRSPTENLVESLVDNVIRDKVSAPSIGSVVYCDLVGQAEHSGIYVGNNQIVHLNGDGLIERVTPKQFMNRLGGLNTAMSIYVSCRNGSPVGSRDAAKLAESMVGYQRDYNLILDNCHRFTTGCLTGNFENSCIFFTLLRGEVRNRIGGEEWRVWDL